MNACLLIICLAALFSLAMSVAAEVAPEEPAALIVTVTPAAQGDQLVRASLPLPRGLVREGQTLEASDGRRKIKAALRVLTWHPVTGTEPRSARRALVTFPYTFRDGDPVWFALQSVTESKPGAFRSPARVTVEGETVLIVYRNGPTLRARLVSPARKSEEKPAVETVESNAFFLWQRFRLPDPEWPRVIEIRADALGGVTVLAHLQRNLPEDGRAPDFGWEMEYRLKSANRPPARNEAPLLTSVTHPFHEGAPFSLILHKTAYQLYFPTAHFKRRGHVEAQRHETGLTYRYLDCTAEERVPMQQASWRRAEFALRPLDLAALTATLEYPHEAHVDWRLWDELYETGPPLDLAQQPELQNLLRYHRDAVVQSMAHGNDWGNVTGYSDGSLTGGVFGMNRLNHCLPIFEEGYRSGDRRLIETAILWCENFYDLSIWWGPNQTGGTRYNNVIALGKRPPDDDRAFMWRSNSAVSFCTKGFASFFYAYEQTGDPRMREALNAQLDYAAKHLNAGPNYTRNVGDVHDFLRLYRFTGEKRYLDEARRLFGDLRTQLSTGDLFTESGKPITPDSPFIDDDATGTRYPFAKPYILGYALAGLPELARLLPEEPKLREVVQAVADFMAESQDPIGGWRYPHPRSSYVILSQGMEHAWQLAQADRLLGPQEKHLDAIERVLRQRILGWRKTRRILGGLTGWERATGKVKEASEMYALYKRPADRDLARDYSEGRPDFGSSSPEGIVYFPEVLAFYLKHRPVSRLTDPPGPDEPLGKVLNRVGGIE